MPSHLGFYNIFYCIFNVVSIRYILKLSEYVAKYDASQTIDLSKDVRERVEEVRDNKPASMANKRNKRSDCE